MRETVIENLEKVRRASPLVHNITNYVVMNNTANALLAAGASPVMAHAAPEAADFAAMAQALVINIGTLSPAWVDAMKAAAVTAAEARVPIILDPVGAGATAYRTDTVKMLIEAAVPQVIRGNASEIMALRDSAVKTKGVDSSCEVSAAAAPARELAAGLGCVVCVSGPEDYITDGEKVLVVRNGSTMMTAVTGMGCTATALTGAFAAVAADPLDAAFSAMAVMSIAGERAAAVSKGPGSLQLNFIDELYNLDAEIVSGMLRWEE